MAPGLTRNAHSTAHTIYWNRFVQYDSKEADRKRSSPWMSVEKSRNLTQSIRASPKLGAKASWSPHEAATRLDAMSAPTALPAALDTSHPALLLAHVEGNRMKAEDHHKVPSDRRRQPSPARQLMTRAKKIIFAYSEISITRPVSTNSTLSRSEYPPPSRPTSCWSPIWQVSDILFRPESARLSPLLVFPKLSQRP